MQISEIGHSGVAEEEPAGKRQRGKGQRKLRILQAASGEFKRNGFDKSRIEDIANVANVAPGTVYNYFPTKDLLLLELVAYHREHSPKALTRLLSSPPSDPVEAFTSFYAIMGEESLRYLDRPLWRHALAAFTVGSWYEMTEKRWLHENDLIAYQVSILKLLQHAGSIPMDLDAMATVEIIHNCGFFWWNQYLVREEFTFEMYLARIRQNLQFLFSNLGSR